MDKLLDKISSYQLFNNFFPGLISIQAIERLTSISFGVDDMLYRLFLYYIVGMILSRIGSTVIEDVYKGFNLVIYSNYSNFLKACDKDDKGKLDILVMENNTYRTLIASFLVVLCVYGLDQFEWFGSFSDTVRAKFVYLLLLVVFFSRAFNKQTAFVRKRVHHINGLDDKKEVPELKKVQRDIFAKKFKRDKKHED